MKLPSFNQTMKAPSFAKKTGQCLVGCALAAFFASAAQAVIFQAEDYNAFYDTTPGNLGGGYRNDGVDIEATTDTGGGFNVGWIESGEWLAYSNLTIPTSGNYIVRLRVASPSGATASVDLNGGSIVLGDFAIPATNGWQNWTTVTRTVHINAGTYSLGVFAKTAGWNLNWVEVVSAGGGNNGGNFVLAPTLPVSYSSLNTRLTNPERGFYSYVNILTKRNFDDVIAKGQSLVYSYIRLDQYRSQAIPQSLLNDLTAGFAAARNSGIKVIPRFAYNEGPYPNSAPDATKAWVLQHIKQVEPVLRANADVIAVFQAGFIGAWGEWHTSTNNLHSNPQDRADILTAILNSLPTNRMVQLRYPLHKQVIFGNPLTASEAHSGQNKARVGHHNDCFLASDTDMGTYPSNQIEPLKVYLQQDTRYVPIGGETCAVSTRSNCSTALAEMSRLNYSYLNNDYQRDVLNGWRDNGCYGEIENRMGYRFELVDAQLPNAVKPGGRFTLQARVANRGWAAPYNPRPIWLVLSNNNRQYEVRLNNYDVRTWFAATTATLNATLQLPANIPEGNYDLSLWLPDEATSLRHNSAFSIRLTNPLEWKADDGLNVLTRIAVSNSAHGDRVTTGTELVLVP